jgi:capsular exopolysaccharide synthesis family protein
MINPVEAPENKPQGDLELIDLREYWRAIVNRRIMIAAITAVFVIVAVVVTLLLRPMYTASALVEITDGNSQLVQFQNIESAETSSDNYMTTQSRVLSSKSVARIVVQKLNLVENPEFNGELTQRSLVAGIRGFINQIKSKESVEPSEEQKLQRAVGIYLNHLSVVPVSKSSLIEVSYESFSPELAMQIANAHVLAYISFSEDRKFNSTSGAKSFLEKEIDDTQARLETAEKQLTEFARKYRVVDVEDKNNIILERLNNLNQALSVVQAKRIDAESQYRQSVAGDSADLSSAYDNPLIRSLREELATIKAQYYEKLEVYKPEYPLMQQLDARAKQIQAAIDEQTRKIASGYESSSTQLNDNESRLREEIDSLTSQLLDLQDRAVTYNILKRELEADKEIYAGLLERTNEVGVLVGMEQNTAQVVDGAIMPRGPSSPNLKLNVLLAALLGVMVGVALALLLKILDNTLLLPEDVERKLKRSLLGVVPKLSKSVGGKLRRGESLIPEMPSHEFAEAIQSIRTSMSFSNAGGLPQSVMITSSLPSEGKSTLAMSIASSFALAGKRVVFLEADIRRESQAKLFGLPMAPGLSDFLSGQSELKVYQDLAGVIGLDLIVAGTQAPNTVNLLESEQMNRLISDLEADYDLVIVDAPPVIGLADTLLIAQKVKSVIFVVAAQETATEVAERALNRLSSVNAPMMGVILNKFSYEEAGLNYSDFEYYAANENA